MRNFDAANGDFVIMLARIFPFRQSSQILNRPYSTASEQVEDREINEKSHLWWGDSLGKCIHWGKDGSLG